MLETPWFLFRSRVAAAAAATMAATCACDGGVEQSTGADGTGSGGMLTGPTGPTNESYPVVEIGTGQMSGTGTTSAQYASADVTRDGVSYRFMANGWGPNFESHTVSWNGTSFTVENMQGTEGNNYEPASYPTVFCGEYSSDRSGECGLPAAISSITSLKTGWSWRPNENTGEYNAAYDIWVGNGPSIGSFSGYLMVWFRDPPGQQPAGTRVEQGITVANVEGQWDLWTGTVNNRPIINWTRSVGRDTLQMEFDVMDFVRDAQSRGLEIPGTHILSVAVGFEIWNGPVTNLESVDFFVDVN